MLPYFPLVRSAFALTTIVSASTTAQGICDITIDAPSSISVEVTAEAPHHLEQGPGSIDNRHTSSSGGYWGRTSSNWMEVGPIEGSKADATTSADYESFTIVASAHANQIVCQGWSVVEGFGYVSMPSCVGEAAAGAAGTSTVKYAGQNVKVRVRRSRPMPRSGPQRR